MASFFDFLMTFQRALKALQLYAPGHPRYVESLTALGAAYVDFLQGRAQVQIAARSGRLFVDRQMEDIDNLQIRAMARVFEERSIHAMNLSPGATPQELGVLLDVLNMKPVALRTAGGAKKYLEDHGVTRIRILATRLEEVSEAGEVAAALLESIAGLPRPIGEGTGPIPLAPWPSMRGSGPAPGGATAGSGPGSGAGHGTGGQGTGGQGAGAGPGSSLPPGAGRGGSGTGPDLGTVVGQVQGFLASLHGGGFAPVDMSGFGAFLEGMGLDRQGSQPTTQGVITKAVSSLDSESQLGVLQGAAGLRPGPLRSVFGRLSASLAAPGLATAFSQGALSREQLLETADHLKTLSPAPQTWVGQLADALRRQGMSEAQLTELVDILTWESRPAEERIKALLEGQRIFEMPPEKVLAFMRELLEAGRIQEFLRLMRHFATGLVAPAVARRLAVAQAFEKIADWVDMPGMPEAILEELMDLLTRGYGREKDPEVHQWFSRAVEHILWFWVDGAEPLRACQRMEGLQDVVTEISLPAAWKEKATEELLERLAAPARLDKLLAMLFQLDRPAAAEQIHPFLRLLGPAAANHLAERLSLESDRGRRGRLLEALKACGHTAEAPLLESLKSREWFVVRNALIVLGEVAGQERLADLLPFLDHGDLRVQTAAVRTVGRLGGREAETALARLLPSRMDAGLLLEVLFALEELKARNAAPAVVALVAACKGRHKPGHDKVRERAIEVLGHLGSPAAVEGLAALVQRHKGFFRESREALPIRVLALRTLQDSGSPEALEAIAKTMEAEPAGPERQALQEVLARSAQGPDAR